MRCRVGDLAIVVNDYEEPRNNGALVRVLRPAVNGEWTAPVEWECVAVTTIRFKGFLAMEGEGDFAYRDAELMPIRDPGEDATDEMVLIAGKPQEVTA